MRNAAWDQWVARARSVPIEAEIARRGITLNGRGNAPCGTCPHCGGVDRFAISKKKQVFHCRGCNHYGDVIALVEFLDGVDFKRAVETLTGEPPPKASKANGKYRGESHGAKPASKQAKKIPVAEYQYRDKDGKLALVVVRFEFQNPDRTWVLKDDGKRNKTFLQKRPDLEHAGRWIWNVDGVPALLYKLPELIEAVRNGREIVIVEGEAKADQYWSWGIPATCCPGGDVGVKKWCAEHSEYLRSAACIIQPDNDDAGWHYANIIGGALQDIAASTRVLLLPDLPEKGDVLDWTKAGGTVEQLQALLAEAVDWVPPAEPEADDAGKAAAEASEAALIEALAKLPPGIEFARKRKRAAKELGVPASAIDDEIKALFGIVDKEVAPLYDHWIVEPWPEPVDGDSLLRDIIKYFRRHVICSEGAALTVALWTMFSWVHDAIAVYSPILLITSPEPECGKTTAMGVIGFLLPRCIASVEISEAALYRSIARWHPSFCIDEFDAVMTSDDKNGLRSVINSGHTRGQGVVRCLEPKFIPEVFSTFAPKALGMIGRKLPPAMLSRCLIIELRRRMPDEKIEKFLHQDNPELIDLRSRLLRWSTDHVETLRNAKPEMPAEFYNRHGDNWQLLFAIADLCTTKDDEDWGRKAREAAAEIEASAETASIGVRLLADIRRIFDEELKEEKGKQQQLFRTKQEEKSLSTKLLLERLNGDDEGPWAAWNHGRGLTSNSLATLLNGGGGRGRSRGGFGIHSQNIQVHNQQAKGYWRKQFEDVWKRYLPPPEPTAPPVNEESKDDFDPPPP